MTQPLRHRMVISYSLAAVFQFNLMTLSGWIGLFSSMAYCPRNVYKSYVTILIGGQWPIVGIITVGCDQHIFRRCRNPHRHNNRTMLKFGTFKGKLNDISGPKILQRTLLPDRAHRRCSSCQKIIQIRHACPCRCFLIRINVVPAKCGSEVHDSTPGVNTLRSKIGTVSTQILIIVISRISAVCPLVGICNGSFPVIVLHKAHHIPPLSMVCRKRE